MQYRSSYEKAACLYDLFDNKRNIDFFCHYARGAKRLLDIGAGTGRIAIPIAQRGVKVCCIEPSPAMRAVFVGKLREDRILAERIRLIAAKVSSFALGSAFPVAIMSGVFDHLIGDEVRLQALQNIKDHLLHGGKLVFDTFVGHPAYSPLTPAGECTIGQRQYRRYVGSRIVSEEVKEVVIVFEIYEPGKPIDRIEERGLVGLVNREQVLRLLTRTGYTVVNEYGDFDSCPYKDGDELLVIEALKE